MDDHGKKSKKSGGLLRRVFGGSAWSLSSSGSQSHSSVSPSVPPHERRPLHPVPSVEPTFILESDILSKDYLEKEAKYMGVINDVDIDFNPQDRAKLLTLLDEKNETGSLSFSLTWRDDVIISFSSYNLKVLWREGEALIHRIPIHQIAAIGFVDDDEVFYLFIKYAFHVNPGSCNLAFFQCHDKVCAEEICNLTRHLFQLAYTNSTMDFFDKSILDGAITPSKYNSYSTDDSVDKRDTVTLYLRSQKNKLSSRSIGSRLIDVGNGNRSTTSNSSTLPFSNRQQISSCREANFDSFVSSSTRSSSSSRAAGRSSSSIGSVSGGNSTHLHLQLHEYIQVLRERLSADELRLFAEQLHYFRTGSVPIDMFCQQLLDIYTERRKFLLLGMRHFIPDSKDFVYFEEFLHKNGVDPASEDSKMTDLTPVHAVAERDCSPHVTTEKEVISANKLHINHEQSASSSETSDPFIIV